MTIASVTRASLLDLVFCATAWADFAQNDGSSPATTINLALHTADPGIAGGQNTNEATYTSYARVAKTRNSANWIRTGNSVSPNADVAFPIGTGGSGSLTYFSTGNPNNNDILWYGTLTPAIPSGTGVKPIFSTSSTITLT